MTEMPWKPAPFDTSEPLWARSQACWTQPCCQSGRVLITGGAGFIGSNLAHHLLGVGQGVVLLDNLSRQGVERNLHWLRQVHGRRVQFAQLDICDSAALRRLITDLATARTPLLGIVHLAAQVAVTTSVADPARDFAVNVGGTLNILETLRALGCDAPPLLYTSTNKVYGNLKGLITRRVDGARRYLPTDQEGAERGINEEQPLDFQSPYGCSKGAADQYVLEYARTYGLPATVFRMSCIYGPHQCGTEDQGWIAHFLRQAMEDRPITIFGDGLQVRDALFVDDLVSAMILTLEQMQTVRCPATPDQHAEQEVPPVYGQPFNIGGGVQRTTSLLELLDLVSEVVGRRPRIHMAGWRPGDQQYYVSDTSKFVAATGWTPQVGLREGVGRLYAWLCGGDAAVPSAVDGPSHDRHLQTRVALAQPVGLQSATAPARSGGAETVADRYRSAVP